MNTKGYEVLGVSKTVTRPILAATIKQILRYTKLDKERLEFLGDNQISGNLKALLEDEDVVKFANDSKVTIEVTDELDPDMSLTCHPEWINQRYIVEDAHAGYRVKPGYLPMLATISFTYLAKTLSDASAWQRRMAIYTERNMQAFKGSGAYFFALPSEVLNELNELYRHRAENGSLQGTFVEYLKSVFHRNIDVVTNASGNNSTFVMHESQDEIIGSFDFAMPEKPSKGEGATHTVTFSYVVRYMIPATCVVESRPIVDGAVLPDNFMSPKATTAITLEQAYDRRVLESMANAGIPKLPHGTIHIPDFIRYKPTLPYKHQEEVLSMAIVLSGDNSRQLFDLTDIGEYSINPYVLEYAKALGSDLFSYRAGAVMVSFQDEEGPCNQTNLALDGTTVKLTVDVEHKDTYRSTFNVQTDLSKLDESSLKLLARHGKAARCILETLAPDISLHGKLPELNGDSISLMDLKDAIDFVNTTDAYFKPRGVKRVFISTMLIEVEREE